MADYFYYSGYAWGVSDQALFLISNEEDVDFTRMVTIKRCNVRPVCSTSFSTGTWGLHKISARDGGINVPMTPFNTLNAGLLADDAVTTMSTFTDTGEPPLRAFFALPYAMVGHPAYNGAYGQSGVDATTFIGNRKSALVEPIILGEGEGLVLRCDDDANPPYPAGWRCTLMLRVGGTATFQGIFQTAPNSGQASICIFRDIGQDKIEVTEISLEPLGPPTINSGGGNLIDTPLVRWVRGASYDSSNGGEQATPVSANTASSLPASTKLYINRAWNPIDRVDLGYTRAGLSYDDFGYPSTNQALVRKAGTIRQPLMATMINMAPGVSPIGPFSEFQAQSTQHGFDFVYNNKGGLQGFLIRPKESFAAVVSNNSCFNSFYFEVEFEVSNTPTASGETAYEFVG